MNRETVKSIAGIVVGACVSSTVSDLLAEKAFNGKKGIAFLSAAIAVSAVAMTVSVMAQKCIEVQIDETCELIDEIKDITAENIKNAEGTV